MPSSATAAQPPDLPRGSLDWLCCRGSTAHRCSLPSRRGPRRPLLHRSPAALSAPSAPTWETPTSCAPVLRPGGELTLTDFMPVYTSVDARSHPHGGHELVRIARCDAARWSWRIVFDPRPEYALLKPEIGTLGKLGLRLDAGRGRCSRCSPMRRWAPRARPASGSDPARSCTSRSATRTALRRRSAPDRGALRPVLEETLRLWREWASCTRLRGTGARPGGAQRSLAEALAVRAFRAIVAARRRRSRSASGRSQWDYASAGCATRRSPPGRSSAWAHRRSGHLHELAAQRHQPLPAEAARPVRPLRPEACSGAGAPAPADTEARGRCGSKRRHVPGAARHLWRGGRGAAYFIRSGARSTGRSPTSSATSDASGRSCASRTGHLEIRGIPRHFTHSRVLCWSALHRLCELHEKGHLPGAAGGRVQAGPGPHPLRGGDAGWSEQLQS